MEKTFDIYFSSLNAGAQTRLLNLFGEGCREKSNWSIVPLATFTMDVPTTKEEKIKAIVEFAGDCEDGAFVLLITDIFGMEFGNALEEYLEPYGDKDIDVIYKKYVK